MWYILIDNSRDNALIAEEVNPESMVNHYEDELNVTVHDADDVEIYLLASGSDNKPVRYDTDDIL